jgi:hypothetical protein
MAIRYLHFVKSKAFQVGLIQLYFQTGAMPERCMQFKKNPDKHQKIE